MRFREEIVESCHWLELDAANRYAPISIVQVRRGVAGAGADALAQLLEALCLKNVSSSA
jgi:hypothetical protein